MSGKKGSFFRRFLTAVLVLILISGAGFAGLQIYRRITTRRQTLEALRELMDGEEDIRRWTDRAEERFSHYSLTEQEKESFDSLIIGGRSIGVRQYAEQGEYIRRIRKLEDAVVSRQDSIASREMERVGNTVPLYASEEKREKISGLQSEIDEKIADGKYKEAEEQLNELDSLMEEASRKKEGLNVAIEQYDYSAYPNVKLYVDVLDGQSGQPLLGLGTDAFYLREENSETGIYENRKVVNAVQMEGHAGLNIALAADVSSSMRTDNRIDGAKFRPGPFYRGRPGEDDPLQQSCAGERIFFTGRSGGPERDRRIHRGRGNRALRRDPLFCPGCPEAARCEVCRSVHGRT